MIKIIEKDFPNTKKLGYWDEYDQTIYIKKGLSKQDRATILAHEAIHVAESILLEEGLMQKRLPEKVIQGIAMTVIRILNTRYFIY